MGIINTSYAAQAGVMNDMWAVRVVRGKKILIEKSMPDLSLENFVGVIYGHARLPGLSRHAVAQCAGRLMQFARRFQQSGVCPNFEVPGLAYDDGTTTTASAGAAGETAAAPEAKTETIEIPKKQVERIPAFIPLTSDMAIDSLIELLAAIIQETTAFSDNLSKEHLEIMVKNIARTVVRRWTAYEDPYMPINLFVNMIMSSTHEGQVPSTTDRGLTIETGQCKLLAEGKWFIEAGTKAPLKFPCALHEEIAKLVAEVTGIKIGVNTSSTGCIINITLE